MVPPALDTCQRREATETARRRPRAPGLARVIGEPSAVRATAPGLAKPSSNEGGRCSPVRGSSDRLAPSASKDQKTAARPSGVKLVGYSPTRRRRPASRPPTPSTAFRYRSKCPLRFDEKNTVAPSGDQTGAHRRPGSSVNRARTPRSRSNTQRSRVFVAGSSTLTTTRRPSGENSRSPYSRRVAEHAPAAVQRDRTRPAVIPVSRGLIRQQAASRDAEAADAGSDERHLFRHRTRLAVRSEPSRSNGCASSDCREGTAGARRSTSPVEPRSTSKRGAPAGRATRRRARAARSPPSRGADGDIEKMPAVGQEERVAVQQIARRTCRAWSPRRGVPPDGRHAVERRAWPSG